ncbi:MAG: hypothetical protein IIB36_06970 [Gemmatimonadetes bacterium]|nr:hypothetical protein [Gemmatimonadota bacterium]
MPVPHRLQPLVQPPEVLFQLLPVLLLRDAIDPYRRILADSAESPSQRRLVHEVRQ